MNITWPNGTITHLDHPALNKVYTLQQTGKEPYSLTQSGRPNNQASTTPPGTLATQPRHQIRNLNISKSINPQIKNPPGTLLTAVPGASFDRHEEDDYPDFLYERNLPKMLSREGPKCAKGDVNGDGLEDVYIGGTSKHVGQLYLQTPQGTFIKSPQPVFDQFQDFEDEAVLFFDADHDGDLDLFVGPGGNNNPPYSRQMQFRLFLIDGTGHFTLAPDAFPSNPNGVNTGVAASRRLQRRRVPGPFYRRQEHSP